jgi:hypothetical protein
MISSRFILTSIILGTFFSAPLYAQKTETQSSGSGSTIEDTILSCGELWEQIRVSDCGGQIIDFFRDGYVSFGAASYSLSAHPQVGDSGAIFSGGIHVTPYVSLNTRLSFIDTSEFGYDFSVGFDQAHAINQKVTRNNGSKRVDLSTFAIANTFSTEASIFYSYGAKDDTPRQYVLLGVGFGLGYADVVGKSYMTEVDESNDAACYQAGVDLINNVDSASADVKSACDLRSFRRIGLGISGRANIDIRYENFFLTINTKIIQLSSGNSLSLGTSGMKLNPNITSVTLAYVYNL